MTAANAGSQGRTVRRWLEERGERVHDVVAALRRGSGRGAEILDLVEEGLAEYRKKYGD